MNLTLTNSCTLQVYFSLNYSVTPLVYFLTMLQICLYSLNQTIVLFWTKPIPCAFGAHSFWPALLGAGNTLVRNKQDREAQYHLFIIGRISFTLKQEVEILQGRPKTAMKIVLLFLQKRDKAFFEGLVIHFIDFKW